MIASAKKALIKELRIKLADEEKIKPELEILAGEVVERKKIIKLINSTPEGQKLFRLRNRYKEISGRILKNIENINIMLGSI
ncbi:hypothetical protein [Fusobacterium ulcerans]|uniref:hypothetical protein n=1 Tax=Fusobacterium ulcerans TaxID=861 RepID=UPI0027B92E93|nr:hypothetical protein [Fusobacterium ulcerans]